MTTWIPIVIIGVASAFVLFAPPATSVFKQHPECSIAEFSPDMSTEIKQLCREARRSKT